MILVTGATGYVGSTVVRRLLSHGLEVAAMVRECECRRRAIVTSGHVACRGLWEDLRIEERSRRRRSIDHVISSDGEARTVMRAAFRPVCKAAFVPIT